MSTGIILSPRIIDFANRSGGVTLKRIVTESGEIKYDHADYEEGYYVAVEGIVELPTTHSGSDTLSYLDEHVCPDDIRRYPEEYFLGIWFNESTECWDVDVTIHTYDLTDAIDTAIATNQTHIYDIAEDGIIEV